LTHGSFQPILGRVAGDARQHPGRILTEVVPSANGQAAADRASVDA
jgi:hypothetical protein